MPPRRPRAWIPAFLTALEQGDTISKACREAGISVPAAYTAKGTDPDFAAQWDSAYEAGSDLLEEEAWRRAREGTEEPVFYQGLIVGHVRKFSDQLLIELLRARRPDKYRQRQEIRHAGDAAPLSSKDLELARSLGEDPDLEHHWEGLAKGLAAKARETG